VPKPAEPEGKKEETKEETKPAAPTFTTLSNANQSSGSTGFKGFSGFGSTTTSQTTSLFSATTTNTTTAGSDSKPVFSGFSFASSATGAAPTGGLFGAGTTGSSLFGAGSTFPGAATAPQQQEEEGDLLLWAWFTEFVACF